MANELITVDSIPSVLSELEEAFYDIPFENSDFQNLVFVVASQLTPARAYRAIGLRMFSKIRAVKEAIYSLKLADIALEENEYKARQPETSDFDRRRLEIESARIRENRKWTEKLMNDALRELNCLYREFKRYPRYTREQFEAEEALHFHQRLMRQLNGVEGARESINNMLEDRAVMDRFLTEMNGDPSKLPAIVEKIINEANALSARMGSAEKLQSN